MNKSSGAMLRDIRSMRKNNTITLSMTSKDIHSAKDLKKARSSQQINLKGFFDNKNQKIKNIDHKLEVHQNQIQKNNAIIQQFTQHLTIVKDQLTVERQRLENQEKKNKMLRDQIERTSKILRTKNIKIDEYSKRLNQSEKENDNLKGSTQKAEQLAKSNTILRKQLSTLQDLVAKKQNQVSDRDHEIVKLKDKIKDLGNTRAQAQKYKNIVLERDAQILLLKSQLTTSENQKNKEYQSNTSQIKRITCKLRETETKLKSIEEKYAQSQSNYKKCKEKADKLEIQKLATQSLVKGKEDFQTMLKNQLNELRQKFNEVNSALKKRQEQDKNHDNKVTVMKARLDELTKKLKDNETSTSQKLQKSKTMEEKMQNLKKKSKNLETLYHSMIPQIQCPFGHQLVNPVTIIPCGHNYCLGCKRGYTKECSQCNGKLKIQAVYRNELMDDIINIVNGIRKVLEIIK